MARLPYLVPYEPSFLGGGFQVPLPTPSCRGRLLQAGQVFDYIHFSLVMHEDRRMALYTAHNIDVSQRRSVPRTGWDFDARIDRAAQTGPEAYDDNPWDRGHLVRRAAVAWGDGGEARDASDSTFFFTNASPQHGKFNQDEWLKLEDWVLQSAGDASSRLCVFTGPIYTDHDQFFEQIRIPSAFWKTVVLRDPTADGDDLAALGFVMKQNELWDDWNGASTLDLHLYQVGIAEIGGYAGIDFGLLADLDEFEWRQPRFRDRRRMRPVPIAGPEDIRFFGDRRRARGIRALRIGRPETGGGTGSGRAARAGDGGCGCGDGEAAAADQVQSLARQVEGLREVVDALLADRDGGGERGLVRAARQLYARIVGGEAAGADEFPDCACIGSGEGFSQQWFCSGVLVHERVVLTAAHCAPQIDKVFLAGRSIAELGFGEVVDVERVVVHPDYDPFRVPSHDVAVLILAAPAATAPVAIAGGDEVDAEDNVRLVGFGYEHPSEPIGFGTKRKVDVPLTRLEGLDEDEIAEREFLHGYVSSHEFHAGRKMLGKDSCNGDSGGPAYLTVGDGHKLAGVTSRAAFSSELPCGDGGIYTRISPYLEWLHQATGGLVGEAGEGPETAAARLYVSAAQPNPAGSDAGNEWVEVTNAGQLDASLDAFSLADRQGGRHPLSGALSAGATRRFYIPEDSQMKLGNRGDDIVLSRGGDEVHKVSYDRAGSGQIFTFQRPQTDPDPIPDGEGTLEGADPC